jgi:hypothetical protein
MRNTRNSSGRGRAVRHAAWCGLGAGLASQAMVVAAALAEGQNPARPINATSHWLWGPKAGQVPDVDLKHTGVGVLTNQGAALFWGTLFGLHLARHPHHEPARIMGEAAVVGLVASVVDYGLIPRRLTPGWELALSGKSVALGMAAMALGLGLGGIAARAGER